MAKKHASRKPRSHNKGRQVQVADLGTVRDAVGDADLSREMLIEHLHAMQDRFGHLSAGHIAALASLMKLPQVEVFETATFYAHFDVHDTPAPLTLRICDGPACAMAGAKALLKDSLKAFPEIRVVSAPCQGACDTPPSAILGHERLSAADLDTITAQLDQPQTQTLPTAEAPTDPGPLDLNQVRAQLDQAGLRGMGGAGFSVAQKWAFFDGAPDPRVLVVNADEGEPGTFKDRFLFENHLAEVLGGMLIAARALDVRDVFVYVRDEYPHVCQALAEFLPTIDAPGLNLHLRRGAGAYICGEETALLESLEGKRGLPRNRPPYPAQAGYKGRPTITHNVETLYWIHEIHQHGAAWYIEQQRPRHYSVSGRVRQPGIVRAPSTATVAELIEAADGLQDGHTFKAFLPGGASGGIFPARFKDKPMDFGVFEEFGGFVGSGALTVLSDDDDVWMVAQDLMRFFADESCGQCTPCRVGTDKMAMLCADPDANEALIRELAQTMQDASICGLGQAAPNPVLTLLDHFGEDDNKGEDET